jgi:hypothetical protein
MLTDLRYAARALQANPNAVHLRMFAYCSGGPMTADGPAGCDIVGGHRPPLQWISS